ncbi:rhomboid family intramembrane serine protease [Flavobacterium pectinovorum]|uniref:rhomboid family intramembrane serine protease n=1 Tax=Flavobacterium pectinovorum TaxID=29533 RepID=UPI001FAC8DC9|nr:rhomboid family intramembrane serine protease [Flavobacterium pectinovorum]MCI9845033.1 rhomboid family intramembrane serine protease [Flavobacterium pectinovorum]
MSFGFPASFSELIPLNNLSQSAFILSTITVCKKLNWILITVDEDKIIAVSKNKKNTWNETISIAFEEEGTAIITSSSNGNQFYDHGRNKKNTDAFLEHYFENLESITSLNSHQNTFHEQLKIEQNNTSEDKELLINSFYSFFSIFIPTKGYFITPILIYLNIFYFFIMAFSRVRFFSPEIQEIIDWGGNYGPITSEDEWWRLISSCFVHIGLLHLITNCVALAYVGLLLERYLKKWGFLITYVLCGIAASLFSLYWDKDNISLGASGAVFGMYGILLTAIIFNLLEKKINPKLIIILIFLTALNLYYSFTDNINLFTHICGFVTGLIFGLILYIFNKKKKMGLLFVSSSATIFIIFFYIQFKASQVYIYQIIEYETRMQEFADMEKLALEAYNFEYGHSIWATKEDALYMIKDRGIYYWNENISLLTELDKLYLPKKIHNRNEDLIKYCNLNINLYELFYKRVDENSNDYDEKIKQINAEILDIIKKIENENKKS